MSRQKALANINCNSDSDWAHTEYSLQYHKEYIVERTGLPEDDPDIMRACYDMFGIDFIWSIDNGLINWETAGRTTDMGHASYASDNSDMRTSTESPFNTLEEVWEFDAVEEYGLPDFEQQVEAYERSVEESRKNYPGQLKTGGYYRTIISGAIETFGWEMLLAGFSNPQKMEPVLDSFFRRTLFFMKAWAETSIEAVIQHDDFVWSNGPFVPPDIYREIIIPRYEKLWGPLHNAGKKVLFCSDGDFTEFTKDVAQAGADGFIFEPCVDFGYMADTFGTTHCLVGSYVDCRDLTFGKWEKAKKDIDRTFEKLETCNGAIFATGNHLPSNIPDSILNKYLHYIMENI